MLKQKTIARVCEHQSLSQKPLACRFEFYEDVVGTKKVEEKDSRRNEGVAETLGFGIEPILDAMRSTVAVFCSSSSLHTR
mmetsp:Transcript_9027/g.18928  ORF Transcript_9027/g.18928 Transcript_9027/m.18928 type:complete len:80 (-) Transcript_9027:655-894(-)